MNGDRMRKRKGLIYLVLLCAIFSAFTLLASQQNDPFYIRLLERAQKSFLAKDYRAAARDFEIAAFGLSQDVTLQAKAYFYLGLTHFYLGDADKSASSLRQGAELLGDKSIAILAIPDSVLPDVQKLLALFDIQLVQTAATINPALSPENIEQEKSSETPPEIDPENKKAEGKDVAITDQNDPDNAPPITLDKVKEGDIIALNLVDTLPTVIERIPAIYPSSASGSGITGTVIVNALISERGSVVNTEIIQGIKGVYGFNQAAEHAVRRWKFEPAIVKGIKVKVWLPIRIVFKKQ
jgi:TonB family protein